MNEGELVELIEGIWVDPWDIKLVKKIDDQKCAFWLSGQSALDGAFTIDYSAEDLVQLIQDARTGVEYDVDILRPVNEADS